MLPIFIFDKDILAHFPDSYDRRVDFIWQSLQEIQNELKAQGSSLWVLYGTAIDSFKQLCREFPIAKVFTNHDYEPSAQARDNRVHEFLLSQGVEFETFKDQCLFEKSEILSGAGTPYTVFTPYKKAVLKALKQSPPKSFSSGGNSFFQTSPQKIPSLADLGYRKTDLNWAAPRIHADVLKHYKERRDWPAKDACSRLGIHLRFGTLSIRRAAIAALEKSDTWLSELIWRDFFMQILFHFPKVVDGSFRQKYEKIKWRTSARDLERWKTGTTGFALVDAGMRELSQTGYMHNRVRMCVGSFLTKHLLIHWSEGEAHFAQKLLDYDLASNNGNWQWVAGTGCDAAPFFRIFNPDLQFKKFDPQAQYVKKWVPEWGTSKYPAPMVNLAEARDRALRAYHESQKKDV